MAQPPFGPADLLARPRRRRSSEAVRGLVRETRLTPDRLVLPLFVCEGTNRAEPIDAIPGRSRQTVDLIVPECEAALSLGVRSVCLFPQVPGNLKTSDGREALNESNLLVRTIREIKKHIPEVCVMTDIALDPYNSDGHDGIVAQRKGRAVVLNDETVELLARMSVLHAQAGADIVAPSDMMDGRIAGIRTALDRAGHQDVLILSYTAKYASSLYGPFRRALDSAPSEAPDVPRDKKTYQMDPANGRESLIEAALDEREGADILMVKPALMYLDVIARLRAATPLAIAAYHVSGEYAMVKAAAERGWLDGRAAMSESLLSIARAGADVIFTYAALEWASWFKDGLVT